MTAAVAVISELPVPVTVRPGPTGGCRVKRESCVDQVTPRSFSWLAREQLTLLMDRNAAARTPQSPSEYMYVRQAGTSRAPTVTDPTRHRRVPHKGSAMSTSTESYTAAAGQ